MSVFKCKMCGGSLAIDHNETVAVCEYCGTRQTLPRLDTDRKANLYDRANHFRRNDEFDKAAGIYEQILSEDNTDAEAYWSLVLCRYGIEYVEDPDTHRQLPTVNRAQFDSVFSDRDYQSAIQYADSSQREVYEEEARTIDEIQKGILSISQKEEPFDVFICYKETDKNGKRTPDSVLANDLYHQLTQEGFKVFFSRITLENKLGTAYEPYIFAALNSARVMVVLGTRPEYFQAAWVKNEWNRYLALIKKGASKTLIPAYKDMDPYDLPEEFSHLQAQDMSKLGFMQDLLRGIKKMIASDEPEETVRETVVVNSGNVNIKALFERVLMFLEDEDWESADEYCEKILDMEPRNAKAYLGKLMAEQHVHKQEELADCDQPFDNRNSYQKVLRFGEDQLAQTLQGYVEHIRERNEQNRIKGIYQSGLSAMNAAMSENDYQAAAQLFREVAEYQDAGALEQECLQKAEDARKSVVYEAACELLGSDSVFRIEKEAIPAFESLAGWRDSAEKVLECRRKIEGMAAEREARRLERQRQLEQEQIEAQKQKKESFIRNSIVLGVLITAVVIMIVWSSVVNPANQYTSASELFQMGEYTQAYEAFKKLGDYKDSAEKLKQLEEIIQKESLKHAVVNGTVRLGSYEQDGNVSNGKEQIEWTVLAKEEDRILVISKYCLDSQPYHLQKQAVTWENCYLREWLNTDFLNNAFSEAQKALIPAVTINNPDNETHEVSGGSDTTDQIFLLSMDEAERYFDWYGARQSEPTVYVKNQGGVYLNSKGKTIWRLRSPGDAADQAAIIYDDGIMNSFGMSVSVNYAVRPAMWIDLSKLDS
ncbi:MAG: TIR domain-containing protein [Clostridiales bacterium]|nr:TIR domain-containing protein [Clostridiales bacterium]